MPTLQNQSPTSLSTPEQQQRRRMLIALLVLVLALVLVLFKDRQILFSPPSPESEVEPAVPQSMAPVVEQPAIASIPYAKPPRNRQKNRALRQAAAVKALHSPKAPESSFVLVSSRAILPPLEVEVIAGNQRRALGASANSVNVKMQDGLAPAAAGQTQAAGTAREDAVERVQLSPGTERVVDSSVEPSYPMLAKQMKVQGAVILQTLISKAGTIDEIQVLSGPAILSAAAREAVRQWRFKPYLKGGQPVDSQARVTVNFTISTY